MGIKRLVIDIGTNSVLALLAEVDGSHLKVISDQKKTTRLGEGLAAYGYLNQSAIKRTADAVNHFVKDDQFEELLMVGTEALRLARNSGEFSKIIKDYTGQEPTIITGFEEAELTFIGAMYNLPIMADNYLFIDVGGGSTELVTAGGEAITAAVSIPIGALKLKEISTIYNLDSFKVEAAKAIEKSIGELKIAPPFSIIATGGTITSVAAIKEGMVRYDARSVHGSTLTTGDMLEIAMAFEKADSRERPQLIPFDRERSELILPGLGIFLAILGIIGQRSLIVSVGGVRFGVALRPDKLLP